MSRTWNLGTSRRRSRIGRNQNGIDSMSSSMSQSRRRCRTGSRLQKAFWGTCLRSRYRRVVSGEYRLCGILKPMVPVIRKGVGKSVIQSRGIGPGGVGREKYAWIVMVREECRRDGNVSGASVLGLKLGCRWQQMFPAGHVVVS